MGIKEILSMDIGSGEGPKPITFQLTLCVLLFIPCPILFLIGYRGKLTDYTPTIQLVGWILLLSSFAFAAWHFRATSSKRNIHPDVLAMIFDPKEIFEANGIQLAFLMLQWKDEIRLIAVLQNMHDSIARIRMDLSLQFTKKGKLIELPALKREIGPSEVKLARLRSPLSTAQMEHTHAKITPNIQTKIIKKAQVRFDRRQVFDTKMKPWLSILMLAGPLAVFGGGRFFTLPISPVEKSSESPPAPQWGLGTLWTPASRRSEEEIIKIINSQTATL